MPSPTYQTVRLRKGNHKSPEQGACVMELASMVAGEPFSDHPISVCPTIGAFLRRYNDSVDDDCRQHLYGYAAKVVGTRGSQEVERARARRLHAWTTNLRERRRKWFWLPERWGGLAYPETADTEIVARRATQEVVRHDHEIHAEVLRVIDELIAIDAPAAIPSPDSGVDGVLMRSDRARVRVPR